ncbi:hypothetical protein LJC38_01035 [Parabacteroides sp. OttesenSCG-928-K15]|nr:hypothetical protein [Parabacteroides sp. OttesenSCG-928-K15]
MKKIILSIFILLLAFQVGAQTRYAFSGGLGTADDPYLIVTVEDLDSIRHFLGSEYHFRLYYDIDLTDSLTNKPNGWEPIGKYNEDNDMQSFEDTTFQFKGTFNGGGKTIKGLWIDGEEGSVCNGLFGYSAGKIRNLSVELKNINNDDKAYAIKGDSISGGIVGWNIGRIDSCLVFGGGVVAADSIAGGIAGRNTGTLSYCISTVGVQGSTKDESTDAGVLVGYSDAEKITSSYYLSVVDGPKAVGNEEDDDNTAGKTFEELQTKATYTGWDFATTWCIEEGATFPRLQNYVFYAGDGSKDEPFEIYSPDELAALRLFLGTAYKDYHFILGNDLDLTDVWTPIGNTTNTFDGSFDGGGYTISGLKIASNADYQGLFGKTGNADAVFKHIQLELADEGVVGEDHVGALIGYSMAKIDTCSVTGGKLEGVDKVGGLIGTQDGGSITSSISKTNVEGTGSTGGLVGEVLSSGAITQSIAKGSVTGSSGSTGGLVGSLAGTITNCFAAGNVTGGTNAGGLVGSLATGSTISTSYAYGQISGTGTNKGIAGTSAGTITASYFKKDTEWNAEIADDPVGTGKSAIAMKTAETYADDWFPATSPVWKIIEGFSYPYLTDEEILMDGGTEKDPIILSSSKALANLNYFVGDTYAGMYFELGGNIDLTHPLKATNDWVSIGDVSNSFQGTLDGKGFVVSGLNITNTEANQGLFGYIGSEGKVMNLTVNLNVGITAGDNVGALAGSNEGVIEKCGVIGTDTIKGTANVGGLVGYNSGTIKEAFSIVSVEASGITSVAGGLVGVTSGTLTDTYATGNVDANTAGGLVGTQEAGTITNSYATGSVTGNTTGGLLGISTAGEIENSFFDQFTTGNVYAVADDDTGGKTTGDMLDSDTFGEWTNTNWTFTYTADPDPATPVYPYFSWQKGNAANKLSDVFTLTKYKYTYAADTNKDITNRPLSLYGKETSITLTATAGEKVQKRIVSPTLTTAGKTYYGVFLGTSESGITRPDTLSIVRSLTTYKVKLTKPNPEGIVLATGLTFDKDSVLALGDKFTFAFTLADEYEKYFVEVSATGNKGTENALTATSVKDGLHTYEISSVTCDSTISFTLTPGYVVTLGLPEEGIDLVSGDTLNVVKKDSDFSFSFKYAKGFTTSTHELAVKAGETDLVIPEPANGVYSFTLEDVVRDTTVTVSLTPIDYVTVDILTSEGIILEVVESSNKVKKGDPFAFNFYYNETYDFQDYTMHVIVDGEEQIPTGSAETKFNLTLAEVTKDVTIEINMTPPPPEPVDPVYKTVTIDLNIIDGIEFEGVDLTNQVEQGKPFDLKFKLKEGYEDYAVIVRTLTTILTPDVEEGEYSLRIPAINDNLTIYIILTAPEPEPEVPVYHTVTIKTDPGITLMVGGATNEALSGKPFSFSFIVDEDALEDKKLVVKAGSTPHYPLVDNGVYTVTLSRVTAAQTIQVSLVEEEFSEVMHKVTIKFPMGLRLLSGSNSMDVGDGKSCTFSFDLLEGYKDSIPEVRSGDIKLNPTYKSGVYTVVIPQVRANMHFTVTYREDPVANEKLPEQLTITPGTGCLMIESPQKVQVYIYEVSGRMLVQREVVGEETITLKGGFYIVRCGKMMKKVLVR